MKRLWNIKTLFLVVYVLVLATQLPHVWHAYSSLERDEFALAHVTAVGAALAFELATGVFTLRIIQGSKRIWTKLGLGFFIVASIVANGYYYAWMPQVFDVAMPVFATLALPLSLALFAEEFGVQAKADARKAAKKPEIVVEAEPVKMFACPKCGRVFATQQAVAGHMKAHNKPPSNDNGHVVEKFRAMTEVYSPNLDQGDYNV